MKRTLPLLFSLALTSYSVQSQTTITNGGFENWDSPGTANEEPVGFNSNKTGSSTAQLGPQTCFRDGSDKHSGSYAARIETKTFIIAVVNGNMCTGVVNAPTTNKADGYIGTTNYSNTSDIRRMSFTGRPDSLVGWYHYTPANSQETGKIRAILHVGHYYDPEAASAYHPDSSANKIADCIFLTPNTTVSNWTRFSVPFVYVDGRTPQYIMINTTSSANQTTNTAGSKLWLDDMDVIYNPSTGINETYNNNDVKVFAYDKSVYVDFLKRNENETMFSLFDITGRKVFSQSIQNNKHHELKMSELNSGIYIYTLSGSTYNKTGKLLID